MGRKGYVWAISAESNAALAAIAAKFISSSAAKYGCVVLFNVVMWGCYVQSLKDLSSHQASTNFAANILASGFAGSILFSEPLKLQWFAGARTKCSSPSHCCGVYEPNSARPEAATITEQLQGCNK